jgi:membrane-associated phospholipid phosphatase
VWRRATRVDPLVALRHDVDQKAPKLVPVLAVYVLAVWIAIVYLGEHYVFDIVTGVIYAVVAYLLVIYWPAIKTGFARRKAAAVDVSGAS